MPGRLIDRFRAAVQRHGGNRATAGSARLAPGGQRRHDLHEVAARMLVAAVLVMGLLLLVSTAVHALLGRGHAVSQWRNVYALTLLAAAGLGWHMRRSGRPQGASMLVLTVASALCVLHALRTGQGIHSLSMAGLALIVTLGGVMASPSASLRLGGVAIAATVALFEAERSAWIPGQLAAAGWSSEARLAAVLLLLACGLASALVMAKLFRRTLGRALEEEHRLDTLLSVGNDWTWETDPAGRLTKLSPSFELRTGYKVQDFLALGQAGGPRLADGPDTTRLLLEMRARRPFRDLMVTLVAPDRQHLVAQGSGQPRHNTAGKFIGWWGVARNITTAERRRHEVSAILDSASVGIALVREHSFERVNPSFEAIFGCPAGSLAGTGVQTLLARLVSDTGASLADTLAADSPQGTDLECSLLGEGPQTRHLWLRGRPIAGTGAGAGGVIWMVEDVTERRRAERELAAAKLRAEAADRAKSAFLAMVSHEIRTPLNGVLGLARMLQNPALDTDRRNNCLGQLMAAAESLTAMVSDVLDLTKIEAGQMPLEQLVFDLRSTAVAAFNTFLPLGLERGLDMRCELDEALPRWVQGDPLRVRQILANYLSNALKFTPHGQVRLQLRAAGQDRVRIEVHDTGPGVSAELQPRLFHRFVQADSSTTRRFGGSGLGLSICRDLAELMGGEVGLHSDGHSFSLFWAELPLPTAQHQADANTTEPHALAPTRLDGLCVLLVDDNPVNLLVATAMLRDLGAEVLEADGGESAVQRATTHAGQLHAVLMDLHMPGTDGLAATRRLRSDPRTSTLPVFALSAAEADAALDAVVLAEMAGFLPKPVRPAQLVQALQGLVPMASRWTPPRTSPGG